MNDNEKRAHDLAIMSTQNLMQMKLEDNERNNKNQPVKYKFSFDTYAEYVKAYNAFLERFTDNSVGSN